MELDIKGVHLLLLKVDHAGEDNPLDHADWADPHFITGGAQPRTIKSPPEEAVILTPKPPREPRINGPKVYGCRPGNPFIYRIPTTGERPMEFTAEALPAGLKLDAEQGIITGAAPARGTFAVTLHAKNRHGAAARTFKIVSGDTLALTPPMGWNRLVCPLQRESTDAKLMREAADVMVASTRHGRRGIRNTSTSTTAG